MTRGARSKVPSSTVPAARRRTLWLIVAPVLALLQIPAWPDDRLLSDAAAQAALIYQFGKFGVWPNEAAAGGFQVCLAGDREALAQSLATLRGKLIRNLPVEFRHLGARDDAASCRILVIAEPQPSAAAWIKQTRNMPVLTVSDEAGFVDAGGMIGFVTVDDRLRFDIDAESIERRGIRINAQVVRLARNYHGGR